VRCTALLTALKVAASTGVWEEGGGGVVVVVGFWQSAVLCCHYDATLQNAQQRLNHLITGISPDQILSDFLANPETPDFPTTRRKSMDANDLSFTHNAAAERILVGSM
jgi:hypothetical protein